MKKKTKNCANPLCNDPFEYKNPKKRFCGLYCKNQAAYNDLKSNYPWEQKMQKARYNNLKLLESYFKRGIYELTKDTLKKSGFDFEVTYLAFLDPNKKNVFRFENIGIVEITENYFNLIKIQKL